MDVYIPPRKVYIDNVGDVNIDPSNRIAAGKFGTVYQINVLGKPKALKLFHEMDSKRDRKLEYVLQNFLGWNMPKTVVNAETLSRINKGEPINGFLMRLLGGKSRAISALFNEKFRANNQITIKDGVKFFATAFSDLSSINQRLVIHDLSKNNLMFTIEQKLLLPEWIDFESWRVIGRDFGDGIVWTHLIADPQSIDPMTTLPVPGYIPNAGNDRYQLLHHLFNLVFGMTPYTGEHPKINLTEERIARAVWLFDDRVTAPEDTKPLEVVSPELAQIFSDYFAKGKRYEIDSSIVTKYANSLVVCPSCGNEIPSTLRHCPVCSKPSVHYAPPIALVKELVNCIGRIVATSFINGTLLAIALEGTSVVYYKRKATSDPTRQVLFPVDSADRGIRFEFLDESIIALNKPLSGRPEVIELWDTSLTPAVKVAETTSVPFAGNHMLVPFRASKGKLIRIAKQTVLKGSLKIPIGLLEERLPITASQNQSWFWADRERDRVLMLNVTFNKYFFELVNNSVRYELDIPRLDSGERLDDMSVHFAQNSVLLRIRTAKANTEYIYSYIVEIKDKNVSLLSHSYQKLEVSKAKHPNTRQIAFGDKDGKYFIWHPSSLGIVEQEIISNTFHTLDRTKGAVNRDTDIEHIGSGSGFGLHFLAINAKTVKYIKI